MKLIKTTCVVLSMAFIAGCAGQTTALDRADLAANTLTSATKTLTVLKKNGAIPADVIPQVSVSLHSADAALHTYVAHANDPAEADRDAAAFWTAFANVEPFVVKYLAKPTTKASK